MSDRGQERREAVQRLLASLKAGGDREEFFRLVVGLYRSPLWGFFSRHSLKPEDCEDLIQKTFLSVHCGLEALRSARAFDGWIFAIALNAYREWRNRRPPPTVSFDDPSGESALLELFDLSATPEAVAEVREILAFIWKEISNFPPQMRRCFLLRYDQRLESDAIASILRCQRSTVRVQLYLAAKRLEPIAGRSRRLDRDKKRGRKRDTGRPEKAGGEGDTQEVTKNGKQGGTREKDREEDKEVDG